MSSFNPSAPPVESDVYPGSYSYITEDMMKEFNQEDCQDNYRDEMSEDSISLYSGASSVVPNGNNQLYEVDIDPDDMEEFLKFKASQGQDESINEKEKGEEDAISNVKPEPLQYTGPKYYTNDYTYEKKRTEKLKIRVKYASPGVKCNIEGEDKESTRDIKDMDHEEMMNMLYEKNRPRTFKEKVKELSKKDRRAGDEELSSEFMETDVAIENAEASVEAETGGEPGHWGALGKALVNKLEKAGYKTIDDLKGMDLKSLGGIEGVGKASAEKILKEIS